LSADGHAENDHRLDIASEENEESGDQIEVGEHLETAPKTFFSGDKIELDEPGFLDDGRELQSILPFFKNGTSAPGGI
jgi:hypothetical protein